MHKQRQTHVHAVRQAADLLVLTEAQEVTIRLERHLEREMRCVYMHMCLHACTCVTVLDNDFVVTACVCNERPFDLT